MKKPSFSFFGVLSTACLLAGCGASRLSNVGEPPEMSQIQDPTLINGYQPISMPMPFPEPERQSVNSLWQTGSRAFFKDQRANRVGDVIRVIVDLNRTNKVDTKHQYKSEPSTSSSANNLFGFESKFPSILPKAVKPGSLLNLSSKVDNKGTSFIERTDNLELKIGATIIQILPNGNLVIQGRQEVLMETELRIVEIRGVIRREDIASDNTIPYSKIAEARIAYGGRGTLTDMNTMPWGQQVLNKIMPW